MDWDRIKVFGDATRRAAMAVPDKPALVGDGSSVTFRQAEARMNRFANALARLGLRPGDRVAVLARNRPEAVEAYGASKAGLVIVPLNWRLSSDELVHPLADAEPTAVLAEPGFVPMLEALRGKAPSLRHFICLGDAPDGWLDYESLLAAAPAEEPGIAVAPDDLLCLMYTSGTTGRPKGAMLTHGGLMRNTRAAADWMLGLRPDDVALACMPLFHVGGLWYHLFPAYALGCTTVLLPEFSAPRVLAALARHGVTYAHFVPTMINALLADPAIQDTDLSRLRLVYYAASSIPVHMLRRAMAAFPHCDFMQGYGSTEAGMITELTAEDHRDALASPEGAARLLTCGRALHCGLRILDPDRHGIGEIAMRSDRSMAGYWRNPDATAAAMQDGWYRTGDLGRLDAAGYLTIADRKNDMIVSGGENVYPREVEDALYRDPAVLEAAVFGVPDPHWVERVTAAVVLRPGVAASAEEIAASLRGRLAGYKCPKRIVICDGLPKSGSGKILKTALRRLYADS